MIAVVDYGMGNLRSVEKALSAVGADVEVTSSPDRVLAAERVVLPGVGAFGDGMTRIREKALDKAIETIVERQTPLLGICLGMQFLFEGSEEAPHCDGFGFLSGQVRRFPESELKVPHTGWNQIHPMAECALLDGIPPGAYVYFNHGYYCCAPQPDVVAETEYGLRFSSVVQRGNVYGSQFHPEKSQNAGLRMLRNFLERIEC